jgi:predicted dehydrogenase
MRLGLIGTGKHGSRYARHIREDLPDVTLAGIARADPVKAAATARALGCRAFGTFDALLAAPDVDAAIAVVPPTLHLDIVRAAAQHGKPLLLEKPAAASVAAGRAMLAALADRPVPVMVAQTLRYNAVVRALLANREAVGTVHSLCLSQRFERSSLAWLDDPAMSGGGMALHTGVHCFDLLRLLTGLEADAVACQMARVNTERTEDSFAASIRLGGGRVLATVSGSRATGGRTGHVELAGVAGLLVGNHVAHHAKLVVGTETRSIELGEPVATVREVVKDFVRALRAGSPMPVPLDEGLRAVAIAEACGAAARSGSTVAVDPLD